MAYYESLKAPATTQVLIDQTAPVGELYFGLEVRVEPLANKSSAVTVTHALEHGTLPMPLVAVLLDALREQIDGGGVYGFPIVNLRLLVTAVDYHEESSTEAAIRSAAASIFRRLLESADFVLIET